MIHSTHIVIHNFNNIDFSILKDKFVIYVYELKGFQPNINYSILVNEIKDLIDRPFYFHFRGDPTTFYILFEKKEKNIPKKLKLVKNEHEAIGKEIKFEDLKIHVIIKLMGALFFYYKPNGEITDKKDIHISQANFYIHSKKYSEKDKVYFNYGINIKITEDYIHCLEGTPDREFIIEPSVSCFMRKNIDDLKTYYKNSNKQLDNHLKYQSYYELLNKGDTTYLRQIKPSQAKDCTEVYKKVDSEDRKNKQLLLPKKSHIDWHSNANSEKYWKNTVGYNIYNFQKKFVDFLNSYNIKTSIKKYDDESFPAFKELKTKAKLVNFNHGNKEKEYIKGYSETGLPIKELGTVYLYDIRHNQETISLKEYVDLLNKKYSTKLCIDFKEMSESLLKKNPHIPLLCLQDYDKDDIKEEHILYGKDDLKNLFYSKYITNPKQTINVNPNQTADSDKEYLTYGIIELTDGEQFDIKFKVSFDQLFLKYFLSLKKDMRAEYDYLPHINKLMKYLFIGENYLFYFDNNEPKSLNLSKPENKKLRTQILGEKFNIKWRDIEKMYFAKNKRFHKFENLTEDEIENGLKNSTFIISKNLVIELDSKLQERNLYNYDLIEDVKENGVISKRTGKITKSARSKEMVTGSHGVMYNSQYKYLVGGANAMTRAPQRNSNLIRQFDIYHGKENFSDDDFQMFLQTTTVKWVKNGNYTAFPYVFDLLRLYKEIENI